MQYGSAAIEMQREVAQWLNKMKQCGVIHSEKA